MNNMTLDITKPKPSPNLAQTTPILQRASHKRLLITLALLHGSSTDVC